MSSHPRSMLTLVVLLPALAVLPGCGGTGRVTTFPVESAPAATSSQTMVRVTEAVRRPGELELALAIVNATADPVTFSRKHGDFTAAAVLHGDIRITGERTPKKSRTFPPDRYTVLAGEEATLRLVFRAADLDRVDSLTLHVVGSTHGVEQSWTIPIPPEPSRPATMASNH